MGRAVGVARRISLKTIRDAETAIYGIARRTPLIPLEPIQRDASSPTTEPDLWLKLETLQPIGSFKIRGAYNALRQLTSDQLARGVWTVSAGNAGQGVAMAARAVGTSCSVLVFETAPQTKLAAIKRLGASIVTASYDECWRAVEQHGSDRMAGHFVHPFDNDAFISGNGTIGLEIVEDLRDVDTVIVPIGGGGLLAGVATAIRALRPEVKIYGAEPDVAAPLRASLDRDEASYFDGWAPSFVDGCGGKSIIPTMWPLLRDLVDGSIVVSLDEIRSAMRVVAERTHIIAEGAGACAVAAALSGRAGSGRITAVLSGGNIDLSTFAKLVA